MPYFIAMPHFILILRRLCILLTLVSVTLSTHAALGDDIANSTADGQPITAIAQRPDGTLYQQIQTTQGTRITEYANAHGQVFALAWIGSAPPDLRQLLGSTRFATLQSATTQGGLHAATQSGQDIQVRTSAAMRQFTGRAWVPSMLPAGFDPRTLAP